MLKRWTAILASYGSYHSSVLSPLYYSNGMWVSITVYYVIGCSWDYDSGCLR